jgi:phosphoribosylformimino-5-aminoimidazole carboxamide ribotide isomerase
MLIPSIDLMGGKIVQLVQGEKKALEYDDFEPWVARFSKYPLVQLIDLDAAMRKGSNRELISHFASRLPCQVGGGIRDVATAQEVLNAGAKTVIIGSALVRDGKVNVEFAKKAAEELGTDKLIFAIDSRGGKVSIQGWTEGTSITPLQVIEQLDSYCAGFLYTHIDTEGMLTGIPLDVIRELRAATKKKFIAAGGIRSTDEVQQLDAMGVDAVVGMAIYTGKMQA